MHRFRKISALFLTLLVLFGSTSFTVSMHFCMEQMESIAFFKDTQECEMMAKTPPCDEEDHHKEDHHKDKKGCCEDLTHVIDGQDEYKEVGSVSMPNLQFIAVLYAVAFDFFATSVLDNYPYKEYSPPAIERDIPVLVQSFLI